MLVWVLRPHTSQNFNPTHKTPINLLTPTTWASKLRTMSAQIEHLLKALRDLPYEDMVMVGQALSNKLKGIHSAHYLADALSGLRAEFSDLEATASREDRVLRALIGSRARGFDLKVRKLPKGWSVISNELRGSGTQNPDVRVAIAHALDQAITAHIMMK